MTFLCASLMEDGVDAMVKAAKGLDCDMVEVRLDFLEGVSDFSWLGEIKQKRIITCMPNWEGGRFKGLEEERIKLLKKATEYTDIICVEYKTEGRFRNQLMLAATNFGVKVMMSYHDFLGTVSVRDMLELARNMDDAGADIAKLAFKPKSLADVCNVILAQASVKLRIPSVFLSLGPVGRLSRVACPMHGAYISYVCASEGKRTDEGQFTLAQMKEIKRLLWQV